MEQHKIISVVESIVSNCRSEAEIKELLSCLSSVNWAEAIAAKEYECSLRPCQMCQEWKVCTTFSCVLDRNGSGLRPRNACPECVEKITTFCTCVFCDGAYPTLFVPNSDFTCHRCYHAKELVGEHNRRAKQLKLPANLTVKQWGDALRHFKGKCAYGEHAYEVLEHYLPLTKGGGTTADNCIPSCSICNVKKGDRHPDQLDRFFPPEKLACVREYLSQLSA